MILLSYSYFDPEMYLVIKIIYYLQSMLPFFFKKKGKYLG